MKWIFAKRPPSSQLSDFYSERKNYSRFRNYNYEPYNDAAFFFNNKKYNSNENALNRYLHLYSIHIISDQTLTLYQSREKLQNLH